MATKRGSLLAQNKALCLASTAAELSSWGPGVSPTVARCEVSCDTSNDGVPREVHWRRVVTKDHVFEYVRIVFNPKFPDGLDEYQSAKRGTPKHLAK